MGQQLILQDWQPFYIALAGAAAGLAGLVFVALSLYPEPILGNPLMRTRALAAAGGFLIAVIWSLIMLLPARVAPVGSYALIVVGAGGFLFLVTLQLRVARSGLSVTRALIGDILLLAPMPAGLIGVEWPSSQYPFLILALAASLGILILFGQAWMLVVQGAISVQERRPPESAAMLASENKPERKGG